MAEGHHDVFHHVRDAWEFVLPDFLGGVYEIPQPFGKNVFPITKFMIIEVVALVLAFVIFRGLAKRVATGEPVKGRFWNFFEAILLFLRDEVVRPTIGNDHGHGHDDHGHENHGQGDHGHAGHGSHGQEPELHGSPALGMASAVVPVIDGSVPHHDHHASPALATAGGGAVAVGHPADQYLPYIWSVFFFILFCNLLGAVPSLGSPTGNLWVTAVLALFTFAVVLRAGFEAMGFVGFWKALVPAMELPFPLGLAIKPLMWIIEFVGLIIKHGVLAVRLFANIMAGHTVIAVILGFIAQVYGSKLIWIVAPASVLGQIGVGLLELFVAFLQAYVFAYLSTLFIAAAKHPH